jgi:hypothetical protein
MSSLRPRKRAKRTSVRACRAPQRGLALARGGFWLCCGRRGLGGYPPLAEPFPWPWLRGPSAVSGRSRRLQRFGACAFISISPLAALLTRRGLARSIKGQSEQSLKTLRREPFSQRIIPSRMEQRASDPLSLLSARLRRPWHSESHWGRERGRSIPFSDIRHRSRVAMSTAWITVSRCLADAP